MMIRGTQREKATRTLEKLCRLLASWVLWFLFSRLRYVAGNRHANGSPRAWLSIQIQSDVSGSGSHFLFACSRAGFCMAVYVA